MGPAAKILSEGVIMRIKCLAQEHSYQQIRTEDLTVDSPWSYPTSQLVILDMLRLALFCEMNIQEFGLL